MSSLTIEDLEPAVADALRSRASDHGRSIEAEARQILSEAVASTRTIGLAEAIRRRFAPFGGVDELVIPDHGVAHEPPTFDP